MRPPHEPKSAASTAGMLVIACWRVGLLLPFRRIADAAEYAAESCKTMWLNSQPPVEAGRECVLGTAHLHLKSSSRLRCLYVGVPAGSNKRYSPQDEATSSVKQQYSKQLGPILQGPAITSVHAARSRTAPFIKSEPGFDAILTNTKPGLTGHLNSTRIQDNTGPIPAQPMAPQRLPSVIDLTMDSDEDVSPAMTAGVAHAVQLQANRQPTQPSADHNSSPIVTPESTVRIVQPCGEQKETTHEDVGTRFPGSPGGQHHVCQDPTASQSQDAGAAAAAGQMHQPCKSAAQSGTTSDAEPGPNAATIVVPTAQLQASPEQSVLRQGEVTSPQAAPPPINLSQSKALHKQHAQQIPLEAQAQELRAFEQPPSI